MSKSVTIEAFKSVLNFDLLAVQEFPKAQYGWHTVDSDGVGGCIHQDIITYRGIGFLFKQSVFMLLKKKKASRGIWCRFKHKPTGREFWAGSLHLPKNEPNSEFSRVLTEFESWLPATDLPLIVLGDYNVDFQWFESADGCFPRGHNTRWELVRAALGSRNLQQVPPLAAQLEEPTFIPRRNGIRPTQIDGAFVRGMQCGRLNIHQGSKTINGSDHNQVEIQLAFRGGGRQPKQCKRGGARLVKVERLPSFCNITQHTLEVAAQLYTKPKPKQPKFSSSQAANTLRDIARASRSPEDWKRYQLQMKNDRRAWATDRAERAVRDWGAHRQLNKSKRSWADSFMVDNEHADPLQSIHDHFQGVFQADDQLEVDRALDASKARLSSSASPPFTEQEVRDGVMSGKNSRAVGPDAVPVELLKQMIQDPQTLEALTRFFNGILESRTVPKEWNRAVVALLPKALVLQGAADLRPISLASHVAKTFARMLMGRMAGCLQPAGVMQCASRGRQAADAFWAVKQIFHLVREWGVPAVVLKLDIKRAFDAVKRPKLGDMVVDWCGQDYPAETACLLDLLKTSSLVMALPWGDIHLSTTAGVKQGSTESPILFTAKTAGPPV